MALVIVAIRLDGSRYTSSVLPEAITSVPIVAPARIVITP